MSTASTASRPSVGSRAAPLPTLPTLMWRSLKAFKALHIALALGISAAAAVMVGALLVGDSMRGSLRSIVLDRLGNVQAAMLSQRFFSPDILNIDGAVELERRYDLLPLIVLPSSAVELKRESGLQRASGVQVLGLGPDAFERLDKDPRLKNVRLDVDQVAINSTLARELDARVGDQLTLRLPKGSGVPADSPLGRRDDASASLPGQRIAVILPDRTAADLDFRAGQQPTRNIFVALTGLQDALEQPDRVNAAVAVSVPGDSARQAASELSLAQAQSTCDQLNARIAPELSDYGLKLTRHRRVFPDAAIGERPKNAGAPVPEAGDVPAATDDQGGHETRSTEPRVVFDYYQLTSQQLIVDDLSLDVLMQELYKPQWNLKPRRAISYLVNEICALDDNGDESSPSVTYSIVTGLEGWEELVARRVVGDLLAEARPSSCGINSWLANRIDAAPGDTLRIKYFRPETIDGREIETIQDLVVAAIVPVTAPSKGYVRNRPAVFEQSPTRANDPDLTPIVPGITDQDSISKWDLPFTLSRTIPKEDDEYWQDYRLTPKMFMGYNQAVRFFGGRFGSATAIRMEAVDVEASGLKEEDLRELAATALLRAKAGLGLQLMPTRALQLQAASGTTPFDGLFMALSFFVIVSALMLVTVLFRLSIEQRSSQWGLLMALGFNVGRVRNLLAGESLLVIAAGSLLGTALGLGYARLMIAGLESWWVGAISGSFLDFHVTLRSLVLGAGAGGAASLATIMWNLRRLNRSAPLDLLRGRWDTLTAAADAGSKVALAVAGFLVFGACGLLALGFAQTGMAQAGAFFGCGMCLVASALALIVHGLKNPRLRPHRAVPGAALPLPYQAGIWSMAWSALTRNLWRSVLTIGLLSVASFLIASMSLFQIAPTLQGSGGFELIGASALPIYRDIGATRTREEALSTADFETLRTVSIVSFRERPGEDASCNNLFQVGQPTILGVPEALAHHQAGVPESQRFQWAAVDSTYDSPWLALGQAASGTEEDPVPVVLDMNTAAWSLHQGASVGAITHLQFDDRVLYFRTVGLLSNSIMQGKLLIGDLNFSRLFPEIGGYRYFLIHDEEKAPPQLTEALENGWSDQGMDVTSAAEVLAKLLAVQNTYISAFQAIGALGLLLGTVGLAVVQVRSVLERRRELALMQALGFSRSRMATLLLAEASLLLTTGITIGVLSALIAVLPYMLAGNSQASLMQPVVMLVAVLVVGFAASSIAVAVALRQPILRNLNV